MLTNVKYFARNQMGDVHMCVTRWPRQELKSLSGGGRVSKMYVDDASGNAQHVGYVIGDQWWTLYKVSGRGLK
jgi:hypothetical protein